MKTLINKNKIRLAGGLLVLLMTAILAIATVKSYAWEWYGGQCWHLKLPPIFTGTPSGWTCSVLPTCCTSCLGYASMCCENLYTGAGKNCVGGPDPAGYGFANCQQGTSNAAVQCTTIVYSGQFPGMCTGTNNPQQAIVCAQPQGCQIFAEICVSTGSTTGSTDLSFLSGPLMCVPEQ